MAFDVTDLKDGNNYLTVNAWNWCPTVELIRSFGIVDENRLEQMHDHFSNANITRAEALRIAEPIDGITHQDLRDDARILIDLSMTTEADDGTFYKGDQAHLNFGATFRWLKKVCRLLSYL